MNHRRWLSAGLALLCAGSALAEGGANLSADAVYHLELRLSELGFLAGDGDSTYDDATQAALEAFQQANGLEVSGQVDDATLEKLNGEDALGREAYLRSFASAWEDAAVLRSGDVGAEVKVVQVRLKELGFFDEKADAAFGDATRAAVERFQLANGLEETGEVDGSTRLRLMAAAPVTWNAYLAEMACAPGDAGLNVYQLQRRLAQLGFFDGDCSANYGERTQAAVERFQAANGLEASGQAGVETWTAIFDDGVVSARPADELRLGDAGEQVELARARLAALGYLADGAGDGFDLAVLTAVRLFQMASGGEPTGVLDSGTTQALMAEDAPTASGDAAAQHTVERLAAVDEGVRQALVAASDALLGTSFAPWEDSLYPGFAFVQCACAAAGIPVSGPEALVAMADLPVTSPAEVAAGDVVAFQSASEDSVSIQLAIGAGEGRVYRTTAEGGWVVLDYISQMNSTNVYRWGDAPAPTE